MHGVQLLFTNFGYSFMLNTLPTASPVTFGRRTPPSKTGQARQVVPKSRGVSPPRRVSGGIPPWIRWAKLGLSGAALTTGLSACGLYDAAQRTKQAADDTAERVVNSAEQFKINRRMESCEQTVGGLRTPATDCNDPRLIPYTGPTDPTGVPDLQPVLLHSTATLVSGSKYVAFFSDGQARIFIPKQNLPPLQLRQVLSAEVAAPLCQVGSIPTTPGLTGKLGTATPSIQFIRAIVRTSEIKNPNAPNSTVNMSRDNGCPWLTNQSSLNSSRFLSGQMQLRKYSRG
jgi:hypothetical protein